MQRYFSEIKKNNNYIISNDDLYHITKVMRLKENDKIEVVYQNKAYACKLIKVDDNLVASSINEIQNSEQKIPEVILCIPLLKEQKMDLIIQKATELGVSEIIPIRLERSIVKLDSTKEEKKLIRWNKISKEASEQAKRITIPKVRNIMDIKELNEFNCMKLVCSTVSNNFNLKKLLHERENCDKILIAVGPEGGLTNKEEEYLLANGFTPVRLGKNIMRVETVPIFFLSVINYEFME